METDETWWNKKPKRHPRRPRERTVLDTSVISSGIGQNNKVQKKVVKTATKKDVSVYLRSVDDELAAYPKKHPLEKKRIERYRRSHRHRITGVPVASPDELAKVPVKGKDKKLLDEASKSRADNLVSLDKAFVRRANGYHGIKSWFPLEYLKKKRKKNV